MLSENSKLIENQYDMSKETQYGAFFTTGNGYMGIRGSLEENSTSSVQGGFIRGLIDEIPFHQAITIDNEYMRKYYINEDAAKDVEFQEGVINFCDILLFRVKIDGETFYPWEGTLHDWSRVLDIENNILTRCVVWENTKGDITEFKFERFASFANDHIYAIKVTITPKNHSKNIEVMSGADLRTKSGGFKMCNLEGYDFTDNTISFTLKTKGKYGHKFNIGIVNDFTSKNNVCDGKFIYQEDSFSSKKGKSYTFEKKIFIGTSRDTDSPVAEDGISLLQKTDFDKLYKEHKDVWHKFFAKLNIDIAGDDKADSSLRFANYHNAISIPRNDAVHSLAAKNLTGEGYNDYVWWDCEVYQCPIFMYAGVDSVKNMLIYRYDRLDEAKKLAKEEGRLGARFPFISSVTGEEKVWRHVRHPYMQYHVVADVAWAVLNYYGVTSDDEFMKAYGLEMLGEISDYWVSRVEQRNGRYEITKVTGCDEHHPYVDNNAYTNYLVRYVLKNTTRLYEKFGLTPTAAWNDVAQKLYMPSAKGGLIPQFDGYFELSQTLESVGGANSGFQLKNAGGMYHKSQIIKQPDVMMMFTYLHNDFDKITYQRNWDYYESMCEASSSLTFPVHAICAFDNNQLYKGYKYFMQSAEVDLGDVHNCAKDGVHAACIAGAWYCLVRGLAGIEMFEDYIKFEPKMLPWWDSVSFNLKWHGTEFMVKLTQNEAEITPNGNLTLKMGDKIIDISKKTSFEIK